jgi:uncharacterized protein (UPF0335 family)
MGPTSQLRSFVNRITELLIERKEIDEALSDTYRDAESNGYDVKALKLSMRRRGETEAQRRKRQETEAIAEVYSAAIGDLFGKPLDDMARRRLDEQMQGAQPELPTDERPGEPAPEAPAEEVAPPEPPETPEQAREKGKQARRDSLRIVENPYHSASPLRAAWDEGWCEEDGSDGMEVPAAWKRAPKPEEPKPDGPKSEDAAKADDNPRPEDDPPAGAPPDAPEQPEA